MTAKTAVVHIGTPKTGTTSIQRCLAQAQATGQLGNVCFPRWNGDGCHNRLAALYLPRDEWFLWMRQRYPVSDRGLGRMRRRYRRFLLGELHAASGAIISGVLLCRFAPPQVAQLREDLEAAGYRDFRIVLYVRDPAEFFVASLQQHLKTHFPPPYSWDPRSFRYEFLRAAESWEQIFPGRVVVRKYTPADDTVGDFAALLDQYLGVALPQAPLRLNPSLSAEGMQILQDYRRLHWAGNGGVLTADTARLVALLTASTKDLAQTRPVLKNEVAEQIWANHYADAEAISARYGVDLGVPNVEPGKPAPDGPCPPGVPCRVGDIVELVDPLISYELLMRITRAGLVPVSAKPARRFAVNIYRRLSPALRPHWLDSRLRSVVRAWTP